MHELSGMLSVNSCLFHKLLVTLTLLASSCELHHPHPHVGSAVVRRVWLDVIKGTANQGLVLLAGAGFSLFIFCVPDVCSVSLFLVVITSAINCQERLFSEMTYYVSSRTLNPTHSVMNYVQLHNNLV